MGDTNITTKRLQVMVLTINDNIVCHKLTEPRIKGLR